MELREYWKIIRKRLWLILLLMVIGGTSASYYTYQRPPQYRSTTTLFVSWRPRTRKPYTCCALA